MISGVKKDVLTVLYTVIFLFVSIFLILPYMVYFSTYMHERAHYKMLTVYGIDAGISIDILHVIPNFFSTKTEKLGVTTFNLEEYKTLDAEQRTDVNVAGIVSDLWVLFFIAFYLGLTNVYFFYKIRFTKNVDLAWILAVNWLLIMWLIALMQITIANVTHSSGDISMLVRIFDQEKQTLINEVKELKTAAVPAYMQFGSVFKNLIYPSA
jgi:hypothetical protein